MKEITKKWLLGVFGTIVATLVVAWVMGAWDPIEKLKSEQSAQAQDLARKYCLFSTGDYPWSSPRASGFPNHFLISDGIIYDQGTGLTWQQGGSNRSISYPKIPGHLRKLNDERFGGYSDWRLPSLAEAWTLLERQETQKGLHIDPAFEQKQTRIWTSTTTDEGYGWFIFFESGTPQFQNAWGSHAYVRAVRGSDFK